MVFLEAVAMEGVWEDGTIVRISKGICGLFYILNHVGAFPFGF